MTQVQIILALGGIALVAVAALAVVALDRRDPLDDDTERLLEMLETQVENHAKRIATLERRIGQ